MGSSLKRPQSGSRPKTWPEKLHMAQPWHVVVVAGPPAAGKGSLCDGLKKRFVLVHVSPGQILREEVEKESELGLKVKEFMLEGKLVPHDLVMRIMQERMSKPDIITRGCLLDNFPLTADQASVLVGSIRVDQVLLVDVPDAELVLRSTQRRIDPLTGRIYHLTFRPPPPEVAWRLIQRSDDQENLVLKRLDTYKRHIETLLPFFKDKVVSVDGTNAPAEVLAEACQAMEHLEWTSPDLPYFGNVAFAGPFSIQQATRAGFYSPENPPQVGDRVVCFQRGENWQRRGQVEDVSEMVGNGAGLRKGEEGLLVTVAMEAGGASFTSWSAFLAPVNDKEYSSLCTTHGLLSSNFCRLWSGSKGVGDVDYVSKETARQSLEKWLTNLEDADGEPFEIDASKMQTLLELFDSHEDASLYLYTTHQKLGPRVTLNAGQDYSLYYRALNNTLNSDAPENLENAMPLVQRMVYRLLYHPDGTKRLHEGGRVFKGDTQRPVPLNMQKLREAARLDRFVRFRQFQSTTRDEALAEKYRSREDARGYLWIIDIPPGFWGARDIHDISWKEKESETLFPPYSAYRVLTLDDNSCHLQAIDRRSELFSRAERHGLRGSAVELLDY